MQWYEYKIISTFGEIDRQGQYWQPDINIDCPGDTPVTALRSGIVSSSVYTSFGQWTVTIKLDVPVNRLATHMFFEHMRSSSVVSGQSVKPGDVVGYANFPGIDGASLGIGLYSGDVYGTGQAWQILQNDLKPGGEHLLDATSLIEEAKNGTSIPSSNSNGQIDFVSKTGNYIAKDVFKIPDYLVNSDVSKLIGGVFYASTSIAAIALFVFLVGV